MDAFTQSLNWFESFERFQDQLEADNLLKLQHSEPSARYYVEASLNGKREWTEWAYDEHELDLLKQDAKDCGFACTVEEVSNDD